MVFCLTNENHPLLHRVSFNIAPQLVIDAPKLKQIEFSREFKVKVTATNSLRAVSAKKEIHFIIQDPQPTTTARLTAFFGGVLFAAIILSLTLSGNKVFKYLKRYREDKEIEQYLF